MRGGLEGSYHFSAWPPIGAPLNNVQREDNWKHFDNSVNAVSFGFVATAILISMFLVMAIFERFLRPTSPSGSPTRGDLESQLSFNPKLGYPSPRVSHSSLRLRFIYGLCSEFIFQSTSVCIFLFFWWLFISQCSLFVALGFAHFVCESEMMMGCFHFLEEDAQSELLFYLGVNFVGNVVPFYVPFDSLVGYLDFCRYW